MHIALLFPGTQKRVECWILLVFRINVSLLSPRGAVIRLHRHFCYACSRSPIKKDSTLQSYNRKYLASIEIFIICHKTPDSCCKDLRHGEFPNTVSMMCGCRRSGSGRPSGWTSALPLDLRFK